MIKGCLLGVELYIYFVLYSVDLEVPNEWNIFYISSISW